MKTMTLKKIGAFIFLFGLLSSCTEEKIIYYEFEGVTITRIYKNAESYFYYGKCNDKKTKCGDSYIIGKYSGFDGLMRGFLVFENDKSVKMIKFESLEQIGKDSLLYLFEFKEPYMAGDWHETIRGNYNNVLEVYSVLNIEQERNKKNRSKVNATYP